MCDKGRFVPPQCQTADGSYHPDCATVLLAFPSWSQSWYEALVVNYNLSFTISYLGNSLDAYLSEKVAREEPVLFYWFPPTLGAHPSYPRCPPLLR